MTVFLRTDRLCLRPRLPSDMENCIAMDQDPEVTRYILGPWNSPNEHRAFLKQRMSQVHPYPFGYWTINGIDKPDMFLGWVMALPVQAENQTEIGWRLIRKAWGLGYATEAVKAVIDLIFEIRPETQLIASIHPENQGSLNVARKTGMRFSHEIQKDGLTEQYFTLKSKAF